MGILGATSSVGTNLLALLMQAGYRPTAFSRKSAGHSDLGVEWRVLPSDSTFDTAPADAIPIPEWICVAPIWVLPDFFSTLQAFGVRRLVVLSSTSRFTKKTSSSPEEQAIAQRLEQAETDLQVWAVEQGIEWIILRPTLIYGVGRDKNVVEVARFIQRFGFFPLFGKGLGQRQPVHVDDVALACIAAMKSTCATNQAYNISGGEILTYREMVTRIFAELSCPVRFLPIPLSVFRLATAMLRLLPRYSHWTAAMAERMNVDMVFEHSDAARDFAFKPRPFVLNGDDIPILRSGQ